MNTKTKFKIKLNFYSDHYACQLQNETGRRKSKSKKRSPPKRRQKRIERTSNDGDESLHDEEWDEEGFRDREAQEVSIHKILLYKFDVGLTEEQIIDSIILKYNTSTARNRNYADESEYIDKNVDKNPKVNIRDLPFFEGDDFQVKVYVQNVPRRIGLLSAFGLTERSISIHIVIFYYRLGEIFALTTNQAWNVVQYCSDYVFPSQIAARLLSEKGQLETTSKGLVGNEVSSKKTMKQDQQSNPYDLVELCTAFTAQLRAKSSLFRLQAFSSEIPDKIKVSLASVRIKRKLDVSDFPSILSHFSVIAKGEETYVHEPNPENNENEEAIVERDTDAHLKNLTPVSSGLQKVLDRELGQLILDALRDPATNMSKLNNFNVGHKRYVDFSNADKFYLKFNQTVVKTYYTMPTLEGIIEDILDLMIYSKMMDNVEKRFEDRRRADRSITKKDEMLLELQKLALAYDGTGYTIGTPKKNTAEKLLNCIEGALWLEEDGRPYWQVMSRWCSVRENYFLLVHKQFVGILGKGYRNRDSEGYLHLHFINDRANETENPIARYVEGYSREPGFFIWANAETEDNLFHMMYVGDNNQIYLYFIIKSLKDKALFTGTWITRSWLAIQKAYHDRQNPDKTYNALLNFYRVNLPSIRTYFKNFEAFLEALHKSYIVYGVGREKENNEPTLYDESQLKTATTVCELEEILESIEEDIELAKPIHDALVASQYIESTDSITSKLLISTPFNFRLDLTLDGKSPEGTNDFVFENIVQKFKSRYNNILLKLDFWRIEKDLAEKESKLLICEIPATCRHRRRRNSDEDQ